MNRCRHQGTSARQGVFTVDGATVCILSGGPQMSTYRGRKVPRRQLPRQAVTGGRRFRCFPHPSGKRGMRATSSAPHRPSSAGS
jgi:hypothetical protein